MGDKLVNILAQSFRVNLKFQLDISAKLASRLKKLRHQMNVFLGILTKPAWNPFLISLVSIWLHMPVSCYNIKTAY